MIESALNLIISALYLLGGFFCVIAATGILRMPDLFMRMHASTKAGTLGVGLIALAAGLQYGQTGFVLKVLGVVAFLIGTAPVAAHLLGRAAFRSQTTVWSETQSDDLSVFDAPEKHNNP